MLRLQNNNEIQKTTQYFQNNNKIDKPKYKKIKIKKEKQSNLNDTNTKLF